jgi:hypothetical protein
MAHIPDDQLSELVENVTEIKTMLKGYNGYPGLCQSHEELAKDYYSFKRRVLLVFGFMVGAGILTGGSIGIIQAMGG